LPVKRNLRRLLLNNFNALALSNNGDGKTGSFPPEILEKALDESSMLADEVFKKLYSNE
jgi:hypothetical protein